MKRKTFLFLFLIPTLLFFVSLLFFFPRSPKKTILPFSYSYSYSQNQEKGEKIWHPQSMPNSYQEKALSLSARAGLAIETKSGQVLWAKNAQQPYPIASLTKIMTAIIAYSYPHPHWWTVSQEAAITKEEETKMGLKPGEKFTRRELLLGMMVVSANDAANAIAENIAGRRAVFVQLMNQKAHSLGLNKTIFYNPTGLDETFFPPNQSTPYELAIMTQYLRDHFPEINQIMGTKEITLPANNFHQEYHLVNILGFEKTYPGIIAGKTGNTDSAGFCLIDIAKKKNQEVMIILLNSPSPKEDARRLFQFAFNNLPS